MHELICPNCKKPFSVDEADYAAILNQVKGAEFDAEVNRRIAELHDKQKAEELARVAQSDRQHQIELSKKDKALGEKDTEIERLKAQIASQDDRKKLELSEALADKEKEIASLKATIGQGKSELQIAVLREQQKAKDAVQAKDVEIAKLKADAELEESRSGLQMKSLREDYEGKLKQLRSRWITTRISRLECPPRW